jgi:hypothetical protein
VGDIEQDNALKDTALIQNANQKVKSVSFDLAATYLMAFFNLDFNALLGMDKTKTGDFNLYGEVAQLGLKNYPIFYTQFAQRLPIMLGLSIPTFGICDHLSLEAEYLKNPNAESIASTYDKLSLPPDANYRYKMMTPNGLFMPQGSFQISRHFFCKLPMIIRVSKTAVQYPSTSPSQIGKRTGTG